MGRRIAPGSGTRTGMSGWRSCVGRRRRRLLPFTGLARLGWGGGGENAAPSIHAAGFRWSDRSCGAVEPRGGYVLRACHLFAGDGGGLWADLILGHSPVCAVEIKDGCCDVLEARRDDGCWPSLHVHRGDVRAFDAAAWGGRVDILAAGSPCQGFSVAGKRLGLDDPRSVLIRETWRVADDCRPAFVFMENTPGVVRDARQYVTGELVARGYVWRDGILSAADVGAPHGRERWWLLAAHPDRVRELQSQGRVGDEWGWSGDGAAAVGSDAPRIGWSEGRAEWPEQQRRPEAADVRQDAPDALRDRLQGAVQQGWLRAPAGEAIEAAARYCGAYDWNPPVPCLRGVVDGQANRGKRIEALGNSQVPLQAATAWRLLGGP